MNDYSMDAVRGWYEPWEFTVKNWQEFLNVITFVASDDMHKFYWRGQADSRWALTTSIHRKLKGNSSKNYVSEADVCAEELRLTLAAAMEWRLDVSDKFNFFLKMQHSGFTSRLLDVSSSPLVAAWFACWDPALANKDGRLFSFGLNPNAHGLYGSTDLISEWPFAKSYADKSETLATSNEVILWEPPYELSPNIAPQQSSFLIGHTPSPRDYLSSNYLKAPDKDLATWRPTDVIRSTNLHFGFTAAWVRMETSWHGRSAYTIKVKARAKPEILKNLRRLAGIYEATLFPYMEGFHRRLSAANGEPFALLHDRNFDIS